ncbi:MAG: hypothetical protein JNL47_05495 [Bacteroidia bacterium]|nr:hypothetical protein [Bacteroidia bacterium]
MKDGNYLIGGYQDFSDNLYKIDTAGNVIWQRFIVMDIIYSVIEDYDGSLVMAGEIYGPLNSWSVIKTDSSGQNVLWAK